MAVLRENVSRLLDHAASRFYAGHQTSDPVGKRWAQRRDFSPSSREALRRPGQSNARDRYPRPVPVVRFDPARPYLPADTLVDRGRHDLERGWSGHGRSAAVNSYSSTVRGEGRMESNDN